VRAATGVITGAGGPAAEVGVPAGGRIVAVEGISVSSKAEIVAQLRAIGKDKESVVFTITSGDAQPLPDDLSEI
jgi:S1-C subfamily serine protease